ncbi:MAG: single-stranded-DNA-specific exonuclease RecJ [Rhodothermales bacterium]
MQHRWVLRPVPSADSVQSIQQALNDLPAALARALVLRGIDSLDRAKAFFRPSLSSLHDPFLMADMEEASERIQRALEAGHRIVVYGDYDVDGTTATALLVASLRELGGDVDFFVPDRYEHGYGLSAAGLDRAAELGADLVIAVDCGVTAVKEAAYARDLGMDLIVCDHHTTKRALPDAIAVLDPKRPDCSYPFKELCGCGVAFKLLQAVLARSGDAPDRAHAYLDLVALATAGDIVPVQGENRALLRFGLDRLQDDPRPGIRALASAADQDLSSCTARDIVFAIGPRINAAGRLSSAEKAVELLLAVDPQRAAELATELEALNRRRRDLDRETRDDAMTRAERQLTARMRHAIVLHRDDWHLGVIGIVASRLVERFYRPTILLGTTNGVAKGSARSIAGINIYEALVKCEDLLLEYGGHDFAAGMSLEIKDVPAFQERFDAAVGEVVTPELLQPSIAVDARLDLGELDDRFWAVLKQFGPFGPSNGRPVFQSNRLELARRPRTVGRDDKHLKFTVRRNGSAPIDVIGFGLGDRLDVLETSWQKGSAIDVLHSIDENTWNGRTSLQLKARDVRASRAGND